MYEDIGENIQGETLEYTYISMMSSKLRVGIIGGGKVGYLKCKNFYKKGCKVEVLSLSFIDEFYSLENIKLINGSYNKEFLDDKHIIVIATDNHKKNLEIKRDCENKSKIYIFAPNYLKGIAVSPMQGDLNNISFAINTKSGNPKGAIMLSNKISDLLNNYDDFIGYSSILREKAKLIENNKKQIIDFICSENFKFIYEKGKDKLVMELFFGEEIVSKIYN